MEAYARVFTVPEKTGAIMDAVQAFFDAPDTVIGSDDLGFCEGMAYRIVVREETNTREYLLFNEALNADGLWYVNPECCRDLERLLLQEGD